MNIIEAMNERRSVRTFNGEPLSTELHDELLKYATEVYNPFGGHFTIRLKQFDMRKGFKPTTYGMIKGACDFFTLGIADDETSELAAGFCFEQVVLKAWQAGLGTCWIAATFKGTEFESVEPWPDGEQLKIVSPTGVAANQTLRERIIRMTVRSHNRKPFSDLFFADNFSKPLTDDSTFGQALAMMRLAPSSTNSQPWRATVDNDTVHFYTSDNKLGFLNCGIGLCHFYETERFNGQNGKFFKEPDAAQHKGLKYVISYKR